MTEEELYRELGILTKNKDRWKENVSYVGTLLHGYTTKITAKALWLLGEMGLVFPHEAMGFVPSIAAFLKDEESLLRERALNALGRIGRADYEIVKPYLNDMLSLSHDDNSDVRLSLIWALENIATNASYVYEDCMEIFSELLEDPNDKVRMEAPKIFRVLGKRNPKMVFPYPDKLSNLAENDSNRVVRIHYAGAVKATKTQ